MGQGADLGGGTHRETMDGDEGDDRENRVR